MREQNTEVQKELQSMSGPHGLYFYDFKWNRVGTLLSQKQKAQYCQGIFFLNVLFIFSSERESLKYLTWGTWPCRFLRETCEWPPWPLLLASFLARTSWLRPLSILGRMTLRPFLPRSVLTEKMRKRKEKNKFNIRWQNGQELKDICSTI